MQISTEQALIAINVLRGVEFPLLSTAFNYFGDKL